MSRALNGTSSDMCAIFLLLSFISKINLYVRTSNSTVAAKSLVHGMYVHLTVLGHVSQEIWSEDSCQLHTE